MGELIAAGTFQLLDHAGSKTFVEETDDLTSVAVCEQAQCVEMKLTSDDRSHRQQPVCPRRKEIESPPDGLADAVRYGNIRD